MNMAVSTQYIPADSILHRLDARSKFFGFLVLVAAVILSDTLWGYALTFAALALLIRLSGLPVAAAVQTVRRMSVFFVVIFIMNVLFFDSEGAIWSWWIFSVSLDGIQTGTNVVLRLMLILVLSNLLILTTPPMEIMSGIEALLSPLRVLHLPVETGAMILSVAVQFIPTLIEETDTIKKAQIARGARLESRKLRERATAMLPLLVPVFLSAFKRADELSAAMEARGYRDAKNRTRKKNLPMRSADWLALASCAAVCAAEIFI